MPNPNPTRRTAAPRPKPDTLPPGFDRMPDGRYRYRYTIAGVRTVKYGLTVDECLAKRYAPKPEPVQGIVDDQTTFADYLRLWLAGLALRGSTIDTHRQQVDGYLIPLFGESVRIVDVGPAMVRERMSELRTWRTKRGGRTLAPGTVKLAFNTLRKALGQYASDSGRANPAAGIKPNGETGRASRVREVGREIAIASDLDIKRMRVATAGTPRGRAAFLTAMTGLRQGEMLGLRDSDVDAGYIHVSQALERKSRTVDDPKGGQGRFVPLGPIGQAIVDDQRAYQAAAARAAKRWSNPEGLLFTKDDGSPLVGSSASTWYAAQLARAGIPHHRWHDLRHYYASTLLNRGVPIPVVAKLLGHRDATITTRVYHHLLRGDTRSTVDVAEAAFV